jgi:D-glycero-alpha-D-manno-heptose-7-phosphate kinase
MQGVPQSVEARAPSRIDLAGGTLDLWPLNLLHDDPLTVNAAIDLQARALVERTDSDGIELISKDRDASLRLAPDELRRAVNERAGDDLEFVLRLASHFLFSGSRGVDLPPFHGCRITTDCRVPAGSGLGGSSTLGIALASALNRFTGRALSRDRLLAVTRSIETQVLRIPTGEQDYHPALSGGALALRYSVEGTMVDRLPVDLEALHRHVVLAYTGVSRSSGISNWDVMKRHLDGDRRVVESLEGVNRAAHDLRDALIVADWDAAGAAVGQEWTARKRLSPAVTNGAVDRLIEEGRSAGALGGKVCGAGGGGCLFLWTRPGQRRAIQERLAALGGKVLDYSFTTEGVSITES